MNEENKAEFEPEKEETQEQESELDFELALDVLDLKYGAVEKRH